MQELKGKETRTKDGKKIQLCANIANTADTELTEYFIKLGVDELSVSPSYNLPIREQIGRL